MRNVWVTSLVILGLTVLSATQLFAFDGNRQGFVLGFAGGLSYTSYEHMADKLVIPSGIIRKVTATYPVKDSAAGFATDFVLGYGFTEQLIVQYTNKVSWFRKRDIDFTYGISYVSGDSPLVISGMSALGVNYYLKKETPSFYVAGAVGPSVWNTPFVTDYKPKSGFGWSIGAGYEYSKHWSIELAVINSSAAYENISTDSFSVILALKGIAY